MSGFTTHKEALDQKWSGASLWGYGRVIFFRLGAVDNYWN